jgi:hypothetical protein
MLSRQRGYASWRLLRRARRRWSGLPFRHSWPAKRRSRLIFERATATSPNAVCALIGRSMMLDASGRFVGAAGLSLVSARQHRLTLRGRQFWTWCAFDAIGIPAGLGEDALAETTCLQCGTPVRIEFEASETVRTSTAQARFWDAQRMEGRGTAGPPHCALMNLFCSPAHLDDWRAEHPNEQGRIRNLLEVCELGRSEWGALEKVKVAINRVASNRTRNELWNHQYSVNASVYTLAA